MKIITQGETPTFQWFIGARTDEVEEVRVVITDKKQRLLWMTRIFSESL